MQAFSDGELNDSESVTSQSSDTGRQTTFSSVTVFLAVGCNSGNHKRASFPQQIGYSSGEGGQTA